MDAELAALTQRLRDVQRVDDAPASRVGERSAIEIMQHLQHRARLVDAVFAPDGREFVTQAQLRRDILAEIDSGGGRANIVDLAAPLNVDLVHIERAVQRLLEAGADARGSGLALLAAGDLITGRYLDSLADDVAELLQERGCVLVADVARARRLPLVFVHEFFARATAVPERDGRDAAGRSALRGGGGGGVVLEGPALYTAAFVEAQRGALRAALLAATRPVAVDAAAARCGILAPLLPALLRSLQGAQELPGTVDAGHYVPAAFRRTRDERIARAYVESGCIAFATLARDGIANPRQHMEQCFGTAAAAPPAPSLAPEAAARPRAQGRERKAGARRPTAAAAAAVSPAPEGTLVHAGHALATCFLAERLLSALAADIDELASGLSDSPHALNVAERLPPDVDLAADGDALWQRLRERCPVVAACTLVRGGSLLVGPRLLEGLRPAIAAVARECAAQPKRAAGGAGAALLLLRKRLHHLVGQEVERHGCGVDGAGAGAAAEELLDAWEAQIAAVCADAVASLPRHGGGDAQRSRAELHRQCAADWLALWLEAKGAQWAAQQLAAADAAAIARDVLAVRGVPLSRAVLLDEALDCDPRLQRALLGGGNGDGSAPSIDALRTALELLDVAKRQTLAPLIDALAAGSAASAAAAVAGDVVAPFVAALGELCRTGAVAMNFLHAPNKKAEREAFAAARAALAAGLAVAANDATLLPLACSGLLAATFRVIVPRMPPAAVPGVVARILRDADVPGLAACAEGRDSTADDFDRLRRHVAALLDAAT